MADESSSPPRQPESNLNVSAQLQHLRNLLNSNHLGDYDGERRLGLEIIDHEISLRSHTTDRPRRDFHVHLQDQDIPPLPEPLPTNGSPSSLVRSRRRAFRPSERLQRHRERYSQGVRGDPSDSLNSGRRATPPPIVTGNAAADDYGMEAQVNREQRFRAKRRKLDDGTFDDETRVISYGDEGRVTPGTLKMEIIRCDGGDYFESPTGSAQLVLQDDKNVYSTKESRCNMLLKHIGGMPFALTRITIKAPSDGFDSPIQEGMIFVAMSDDKMLEKTAAYDKYSPKGYRSHHPVRRYDQYRPSQEYLNSSRSPLGTLRSMERARYLRDSQHPWLRQVDESRGLETSVIPGFDVSFVDTSDHENSPSFPPRSPVLWRDLDAEYSLRSYTDRYRPHIGNDDNRDNASVTSSESEDEYAPLYRERGNTGDDLDEEFTQHRRYLNHMRAAHERGDHDFYILHPSRRAQQDWRTTDSLTRRSTPSRLGTRTNGSGPDDPTTGYGASSKTTNDNASGTLLPADTIAPHARFSMAESQTSIAINFDPPVAGRYILIKLWASCPASNIDIQCIIPQGYGGPRFFPSVGIR